MQGGGPGGGFVPVGRRVVAHVSFLALDRLHLFDPEGNAVARIAVGHPGAVAIVALDGDEVVLLSQYRAPMGREILEIPAGKLDFPGEDLVEVARRELAEEVGLAGTITPLLQTNTTPGFSNEAIAIFLATDLGPVPSSPHGAEERAATLVRMPLPAAVDAVYSGLITDAKTIIGILTVAARG